MLGKGGKVRYWFLWPFLAIWNLLALVLSITGRLVAMILGIILMVGPVAKPQIASSPR